MRYKTAVLISTCDRPKALFKTLWNFMKVDDRPEILVVDDSKESGNRLMNFSYCEEVRNAGVNVTIMKMARNRGLAAVMNIGLCYLLADKTIDWISYMQDDVEFVPELFEVMDHLGDEQFRPILSGRSSSEHPVENSIEVDGIPVHLKKTCSAVHLHACRKYWEQLIPIPTVCLGAPCGGGGTERGTGSNVDWWIVSWAPGSIAQTGGHVACVPGLLRTFNWKREDSSWNNQHKGGEDECLKPEILSRWKKPKDN